MSNENVQFDSIRPVIWTGQALRLLDQRLLPEKEVYIDINTTQALAEAIKDMCVRGAPAIGISAAFGAVIAAQECLSLQGTERWQQSFQKKLNILAASRPTAVNLFNAINAAKRLIAQKPVEPIKVLEHWAKQWLADDILANKEIGRLGAGLIEDHSRVLTHCNAGALATGGYGTALGVIRAAYQQSKLDKIYSAETRPWNQGSRLSLWEFNKENIPATLIADTVAATLMQQNKLDWIIVGADRITANGDVINKVGTYSLAVLAKHHGVKLMVAAPLTTLDWETQSGFEAEIETRDAKELLPSYYTDVAENCVVDTWNPVFDVTPAELVSAIVTEKAVLKSPNISKMAEFKQQYNQ